jgi:iron complex outermembrane receptor protein
VRWALAIFAAALFLFRLNIHGQTATPSPATTPPSPRVIVISEFIPTAETTTALPVTLYPAELLRKLGANTPIEGLRELPSFVGRTATENDSNGGDGSANLNLLGLGAPNTLVLINGRRTFLFRDINAIPISALSSVEVLKHGAAPVYGSDGVAGVVNFILINGPDEKPYEAAELNTLYGNTTETDAHVRQVYLRGGVTGLDGKVSIAAVGEYYSRANLFARDREISRTADLSNDGTGLGLGGPNNNSPTFGGRVSVASAATSMGAPSGGALVLINRSENKISAASYRPFDPAGTGTDPSRFNFRAFSPAIPAMEKAMYFVTGRYKIFGEERHPGELQHDGLQLYGDILYSKVKQDNGQAGTPFTLSSGTNGRDEARASPFNPFGNNLTSLSYRLQQELQNRSSFFDKDYYRYVVGIQGDFNIKDNDFISHWGYDSAYLYERLDSERVDGGDARRSYLRALIAPNGFANAASPLPFVPMANRGTFNPFIGINAPVIGTAPTYVNGVPTGQTAPYDNRIAALDWTNGGASYIGHSFFYERDWLADAKFNAHLFPNLPNRGIDLAAGYERRESNQKQIADPVQASNDQLGFNPVAPLKYRQEVESWFFEIGIPFVTSSMVVPWVRALDLEIAWRRDEFTDTNLLTGIASPLQTRSSFVNENPDENFGGSPRVALRYQPIPDITLRASWQQSIRPPTYGELFTPITQVFPVVFGGGPGIIPQPSNGIFEGGNPQVKPETTDSYSAGIVWEPKPFPGFTLTVDAYQFSTTNLILDPDTFSRVLLTQNTPDPDGCGLGAIPGGGPGLGITRDINGGLDCIDSGFANAGKRLVQGLEVTVVHEIPTDRSGLFTVTGGWNHFFTWKGQAGSGNPRGSFLGNYDNQTLPFVPGAIPWNKGFLRGEWQWKHVDFVATGNYIGDFRDDPSFDSIVRAERRNVPSYITLDLQLSYEFVKPPVEPSVKESKDSNYVIQTEAATASIWQRMLWGTKLTVGVNNAFDRNPPTVLAAPNDNYDTSLYSIRNRYWYVALSKKF